MGVTELATSLMADTSLLTAAFTTRSAARLDLASSYAAIVGCRNLNMPFMACSGKSKQGHKE
ncbi:hypothetical protein DPMN_011212 [Dreissena polymorpha]|uniref:Uncharacterized protein n=1 Tax=Dreissena polymorpha TaxID=45954 RepID=A0A9D4N372_DREPO|nr:hypothetical protein DPMN_011212 [Dreissena polymorpha]